MFVQKRNAKSVLVIRSVILFFLTLNGSPFSSTFASQSRTGQVYVRVSTDRDDWTYQPGQIVKFHISVVQDEHPVRGAKIHYTIGPEMMPPTIDQTAVIPPEGITVEGSTMKQPGFLRCIAMVEMNGKTYRGLSTAGFLPGEIKPTTEDPPDFDAFWNKGKDALAQFPLDAKLTVLPELSTPGVNVYQVNLQNIGSDGKPSRLYGILCEPRAEGKYPALLAVPGAGVRPYRGFYPALSDLTGYLQGRAGGWPHMFRAEGAGSHRTQQKIETSHYYDVVNFARRIKVPGIYSWGYNDEVCPPTSMFAAYNVIPARKELLLALEMGHATTPEQTDKINAWLESFLKGLIVVPNK